MDIDFNEFQKMVQKSIDDVNNQPVSDFENYSPNQMKHVIYDTFGEKSPIQIKSLSKADYAKVPLFNQIKYLVDLIKKDGEIKLTKKGFLPTKVVAELYEQGFMKDPLIKEGISKLYKETDSDTVHLTRILLEISCLTKKRNGRLSLTKASKKIVANNDSLFKLIITSFATKFNWAYFDGYEENSIGQMGVGFTLVLLAKYGDKERANDFYADKYFKAFPHLMQSEEPPEMIHDRYYTNCYSIRTFERFLDYFGVITITKKNPSVFAPRFIKKTPLFDRIFAIELNS